MKKQIMAVTLTAVSYTHLWQPLRFRFLWKNFYKGFRLVSSVPFACFLPSLCYNFIYSASSAAVSSSASAVASTASALSESADSSKGTTAPSYVSLM